MSADMLTIYKKCSNLGATPSDTDADSICTAIQKIYDDRYSMYSILTKWSGNSTYTVGNNYSVLLIIQVAVNNGNGTTATTTITDSTYYNTYNETIPKASWGGDTAIHIVQLTGVKSGLTIGGYTWGDNGYTWLLVI
jgi:hypothetical protein